jgi:4-amino-4-deoxy-L-arabinose transferase-like glycosyltransferase
MLKNVRFGRLLVHRPKLVLAAVLLLATSLRLPYLQYGLPGTTYVDAFRFVDEASRLAKSPSFTPQDYIYPGFLKLLLALIYGAFGIEDATWLYLVPRILATVFDLGSVALIFVLAQRLSSTYGGVVAASLHAVSIISVTSARTETADSMLTFFMTAALVCLTTHQPRVFHLVIGGLLVGCAAGTKYTGAYGFVLVPPVFWLAARGSLGARRAAVGAGAGFALACVAFLATTPWFVPKLDTYLRSMQFQAEVQRYGQIGHVQSTPFDYLVSSTPTWEQPWLSTSLLGNEGPLVLAVCLVSIALALLGFLRSAFDGGTATTRVIALYAVFYYVLISGSGHVKAIRYLLPVLPAVWTLVGATTDLGVRFLRTHVPACPRSPWLEVGLAMALLAVPATRTVPYLTASARPMTNDLVLAWARDNLPHDGTVLLSPFYVANLRALNVRTVGLAGAGSNQYRLKSAGADTESKPLFRPELVDSMRQNGIQYIVLNSYFEDSLKDTPENRRWFPNNVAAYREFCERLGSEAVLLYSVRGQSEGRLGPDVEVYHLTGSGS